MYCRSCGRELNKNARFCDLCGTAVEPVAEAKILEPKIEKSESTQHNPAIVQPVSFQPEVKVMYPYKKKWTAFWLCFFLGNMGAHRFYVGKTGTGILWLLTCGCFFVGSIVDLLNILLDEFTDKQGHDLVSNVSNTTRKTPKKPRSTKDAAIILSALAVILVLFYLSAARSSGSKVEYSKSQIIDMSTEIEYDKLARNPESYEGQYFKFTGQVAQVVQYGSSVQLRVNVTPVYWGEQISYWQDTIYVTAKLNSDGDRILENDIITLYGECTGLYTYTAIFGNSVSIPGIRCDVWRIDEQA